MKRGTNISYNATGHLFRPVLVLHTAVHSSDWWHCSVEQCCTDGRCCQGSTMVKVLSDCLPVEAIFSHFPNDALNYYWHYYDSYNELNLLHYSFMSHNQHLQHVWECVSAHIMPQCRPKIKQTEWGDKSISMRNKWKSQHVLYHFRHSVDIHLIMLITST